MRCERCLDLNLTKKIMNFVYIHTCKFVFHHRKKVKSKNSSRHLRTSKGEVCKLTEERGLRLDTQTRYLTDPLCQRYFTGVAWYEKKKLLLGYLKDTFGFVFNCNYSWSNRDYFWEWIKTLGNAVSTSLEFLGLIFHLRFNSKTM